MNFDDTLDAIHKVWDQFLRGEAKPCRQGNANCCLVGLKVVMLLQETIEKPFTMTLCS
jgi:hypothetical protein